MLLRFRLKDWVSGLLGHLIFWLQPDAIVLPNWSTHKKYIKDREKNNYDGGATSNKLQRVLNHRRWIKRWVKKGVPEFKSVQEAVEYGVQEEVNAIATDEQGNIIGVETQALTKPTDIIEQVVTGKDYNPYIVSKEAMLKKADKLRQEFLARKRS